MLQISLYQCRDNLHLALGFIIYSQCPQSTPLSYFLYVVSYSKGSAPAKCLYFLLYNKEPKELFFGKIYIYRTRSYVSN